MGFQLQEKRMRAVSNNLPGWSRARASQTTETKRNINLPTTWYPGKNTADAHTAIPPDMESRSSLLTHRYIRTEELKIRRELETETNGPRSVKSRLVPSGRNAGKVKLHISTPQYRFHQPTDIVEAEVRN